MSAYVANKPRIIRSFDTLEIEFPRRRERVKRIGSWIQRTTLWEHASLDATATRDDLWSPPGIYLEALKDRFSSKHSIRIYGQWRIIFKLGTEALRIISPMWCITKTRGWQAMAGRNMNSVWLKIDPAERSCGASNRTVLHERLTNHG